MNETKLTDFTGLQLNFLFLMLDEKRKDFESKIEIVEKFDASEQKYELYGFYAMQLDICTQWITKVDEAALVVKMREKILLN